MVQKRIQRERTAQRKERGWGMQVSFLKLKRKKKQFNQTKNNQTIAVKHCRAFQISVAHQKTPRSTRPTTHTIQNQTDQKVNQGHLLTEIRTRQSCFHLGLPGIISGCFLNFFNFSFTLKISPVWEPELLIHDTQL